MNESNRCQILGIERANWTSNIICISIGFYICNVNVTWHIFSFNQSMPCSGSPVSKHTNNSVAPKRLGTELGYMINSIHGSLYIVMLLLINARVKGHLEPTHPQVFTSVHLLIKMVRSGFTINGSQLEKLEQSIPGMFQSWNL